MDVSRMIMTSHRHDPHTATHPTSPTSTSASSPAISVLNSPTSPPASFTDLPPEMAARSLSRMLPGWVTSAFGIASVSDDPPANAPFPNLPPLPQNAVSPAPVEMQRDKSIFSNLKGLGIFSGESNAGFVMQRIPQRGLALTTRLLRSPRIFINSMRHYANAKERVAGSLESTAKHLNATIDAAKTAGLDKHWEEIIVRKDSLAGPPCAINSNQVSDESKRLLRVFMDSGDRLELIKRGLECGEFYIALDPAGRAAFLTVLAKDFGSQPNASPNASPEYQSFFSQINLIPGGLRFLIQLRQDLMSLARKKTDASFKQMNHALTSRMCEWFRVENLNLEKITWASPIEVLEKIILYEGVHAVPSLEALKERLLPGRACYAFFHQSMPLEPLAFIHVSFEPDVQRNVQTILQHPPSTTMEDARVAIFYTISSPQKGLSGIDLGNLLIKQAVKDIQKTFPQIHTFTTLSPIPGFRTWLEMQMNLEAHNTAGGAGESVGALLLPREVELLKSMGASGGTGIRMLESLLSNNTWLQSSSNPLKPTLIRLCTRYLLLEKKRTFPLDPVANFHLRNGACIYHLNWMGDVSEKGVAQSFGMM
ncbi:hypothetical protein HDU98_002724, partial [Podochytrium sp. JEL0797]